ncbi:hypothetical protein [Streptomyces sp. SID5910]|uniref:hypothetical protein n=1 Tax=Streptomyces sp. SID5910 TaxID=2690312 RepID=UPI0013691CC1|nr:hypothetical protein [Streptomyces sp. SID5910]MYR40765.1 hypothetical protein [Streptomyces sp. SID5910]
MATERAAARADKWSIAWILLALALWGVFTILMLSSYGPEYDGEPRCEGPLLNPYENRDGTCASELREWPALLGILAVSTITTVVAAATTIYAKLLPRLAPQPITHTQES